MSKWKLKNQFLLLKYLNLALIQIKVNHVSSREVLGERRFLLLVGSVTRYRREREGESESERVRERERRIRIMSSVDGRVYSLFLSLSLSLPLFRDPGQYMSSTMLLHCKGLRNTTSKAAWSPRVVDDHRWITFQRQSVLRYRGFILREILVVYRELSSWNGIFGQNRR